MFAGILTNKRQVVELVFTFLSFLFTTTYELFYIFICLMKLIAGIDPSFILTLNENTCQLTTRLEK